MLIQADPTDAAMVREALRRCLIRDYNVMWVTSCAMGLQSLDYLGEQSRDRPDGIRAILLDVRLPDAQGLSAFERVSNASQRIPIVILASPQDELLAKMTVSRGAYDYVLKNYIEHYYFPKTLDTMIIRIAELSGLAKQMDRVQRTLDSLGNAVISTDLDGSVCYLNAVAEQLTGWRRMEVLGRRFSAIFGVIDGDTSSSVLDPLYRATHDPAPGGLAACSIMIRRDGSRMAIEDWCAAITDSNGLVTGAVMTFQDMTETYANNRRLAHLAQHDVLTDLPNKSTLHDRLIQAVAMARRNQTALAVLFLDLDRFKLINDSLGHLVGDRLLQTIAMRLKACVRESDTVSRQGGDEFVVLLPAIASAQDAATCAEKLLQAVKLPCLIDEQEIFVTASVGVVLYPDDGADVDELLDHADSAMYQAKGRGRSAFNFYRADVDSRALERRLLENGLRRAIQRSEFVLHYQPIINLQTRSICGVEALIRWIRPGLGTIYPDMFIPVAEESGLIVPIGQWVLREACQQAAAWRAAGVGTLRIAVNISTVELRSEFFASNVAAILDATGFDPALLDLEITETFLMQDSKATLLVLNDLKAIGIHVALDDFGTGYSSLSYMKRFPFDVLKIDRSFVSDLMTGAGDENIVSAVINMGKSLNKRVVAEGVMTLEQLEFLHEHGCTEAQGYYISPPLTASALVDHIALQSMPTGHADVLARHSPAFIGK